MQPRQLPSYLYSAYSEYREYSEYSEYRKRSKYSPSSVKGVVHICAARMGETPSRRESASFEAAPFIGRLASLTWHTGQRPLVQPQDLGLQPLTLRAAASNTQGCGLTTVRVAA